MKERRFKGKTPYNTLWLMTNNLFPFLNDYWRSCLTAYQRVTRKWADEDVWSIDYFLCDILPPMLEHLKKTKHGVPQKYIDKANAARGRNVEMWDNTPDEIFQEAEEMFNASVDVIIQGFEAHKKLCDYEWEDKDDRKKLQETFEKGMVVFTEDFGNLWD